VCTMGDEVIPCVARRGRPCRRSKGVSVAYAQRMSLPLTVSCSSKSRLVLPSWFYLSGTGSPG